MSRRAAVLIGALLLIVWSIPWAIGGCSVVLDGHRYFFLADDPTISMRYGRNLANGLGLVWNPGEHVEGYSNLLWVLYMAMLHRLPIAPAHQALAIMITNLGIAIAGLVLLHKITQKLTPGRAGNALAFLVVMANAINGDAFEWMLRGFETSLMATLLLAGFYRLMGDADEGRPRPATYLLIALLTLVRTDGLILAAPLFILGLLTTPQRNRSFAYSAIAMLLPAAHLWFRWRYYGDYLPNTAYLKLFGYAGRFGNGLRWTGKFYATYPFAVALVVYAALRVRDWPLRAGAFLCLMFTGYTVYIGGDSFSGFRFLAPIIPLFLLVAFATAWRVTENVEERLAKLARFSPSIERALILTGALLFVAAAILWPQRGASRVPGQSAIAFVGAIGVAVATWYAARAKEARTPARFALIALLLANMPMLLWSHRRPEPWGPGYPDDVRMGLYLREHSPEDAVVAYSAAGIVAYFSGRKGIDFLGKCDPHISHMPAASKGTVPGHNKFDYDYSLGKLHPDYVIGSFKLPAKRSELPAKELELREDAEGDFAFMGTLYFNDTFRKHCLPNRVDVPPEFRRSIFTCKW